MPVARLNAETTAHLRYFLTTDHDDLLGMITSINGRDYQIIRIQPRNTLMMLSTCGPHNILIRLRCVAVPSLVMVVSLYQLAQVAS